MEFLSVYYLLVLVVVIVCVIRIYISGTTDKVVSKRQFSSLGLDTGDLLFVKYNNSLGYFMRFWSGSPWTHIAMVYRKDSELYVMETANYPNHKGVLFIPYGRWRRLNRKCDVSVMKLSTPEGFNRDKILTSFSKLSDKQLDTFGLSWLRLLTSSKYETLKNKENITCYEMIVHILQDSGIAKKILSPSSYFPTNIINQNLPLNEGFSYENLAEL